MEGEFQGFRTARFGQYRRACDRNGYKATTEPVLPEEGVWCRCACPEKARSDAALAGMNEQLPACISSFAAMSGVSLPVGFGWVSPMPARVRNGIPIAHQANCLMYPVKDVERCREVEMTVVPMNSQVQAPEPRIRGSSGRSRSPPELVAIGRYRQPQQWHEPVPDAVRVSSERAREKVERPLFPRTAAP